MAPSFYSSGDQEIYNKGFSFIPRDIFRFGDPNLNFGTSTTETPTGINTLLSQNINDGGGDGAFNPYNTDMSRIRQDYNAFPSRQAGEIYSKTFNPQPYGTGVESAQAAYNQANQALAQGMDPNSQGYGSFTGGTLTGLKDIANEIIMNNKEQYGAQGQYVDPYDTNYSSMTEAQKFMDNYPDYYGVPSGVPETGIKGLIKGYLENSLLGKGFGMAKDFLGRVIPINERAIMENEARGAGIFTDDIGRIVTDDYNTAGGIMAGYNLNALTKEGSTALTDRKNTVMNTLENKYGLNKSAVDALRKDPNYTGPAKTLIDRLDLFDEFEDEINTINTKKKLITKMRKDKKAADKKKEEDDAAAAAAAAAAAKAEKIKKKAFLDAKNAKDSDNDGVPDYVEKAGGTAPGGMYATDYQGDPSPSSTTTSSGGGGGYRGGGADMGRGGGASYSGSASTGAKDGFGYGLADGGRVYYMDGGLADLVDIYD